MHLRAGRDAAVPRLADPRRRRGERRSGSQPRRARRAQALPGERASSTGRGCSSSATASRYATPLLVCLAAVVAADIAFAVDSIPAAFAITRESFIIWMGNVFALLGLRALFVLVEGLIKPLPLPEPDDRGRPRARRREAAHRGPLQGRPGRKPRGRRRRLRGRHRRVTVGGPARPRRHGPPGGPPAAPRGRRSTRIIPPRRGPASRAPPPRPRRGRRRPASRGRLRGRSAPGSRGRARRGGARPADASSETSTHSPSSPSAPSKTSEPMSAESSTMSRISVSGCT